jgi:hypothetical protein
VAKAEVGMRRSVNRAQRARFMAGNTNAFGPLSFGDICAFPCLILL